jgi:hypothetical protein
VIDDEGRDPAPHGRDVFVFHQICSFGCNTT